HVESLELPAACFDLIVSNNGLNNVADLPLALSVCARLARPRTQLVFTANLPGTMAGFYEVLGRALDGAGVADGQKRIEEHIRARRRPVEELVALSSAAGFETYQVSRQAFRWRFASAEALFWHHFIRLGFLEAWRALVSEEAQPEVFRTVTERLDANALQLEIPFACISARRR
ncbi:MAG TPA: methyltransferase domain-containing protein, partial [Solirubrobacteraceae bacterium]